MRRTPRRYPDAPIPSPESAGLARLQWPRMWSGIGFPFFPKTSRDHLQTPESLDLVKPPMARIGARMAAMVGGQAKADTTSMALPQSFVARKDLAEHAGTTGGRLTSLPRKPCF